MTAHRGWRWGAAGAMTLAAGLVLVLACATPTRAQVPAPTPAVPQAEEVPQDVPPAAPEDAEIEEPPPAEDLTRTAGGALQAFMASRNYRSIRALKGVMTPRLQAVYDHDSAQFNGKRGIRLAAFDFTERDMKPVRSAGRPVKAQTAAIAAETPPAFTATVRSLWEEQGEAVEQRVETVEITQQENGLWRVSGLRRQTAERLRFPDPIPGVTTLRMVLRAWHRSDLAGAKPHLSAAFLKRYEMREEALARLFGSAPGTQHAAYQIVELKPRGEETVLARVKLYETVSGEPRPLEGSLRSLRLIKKGPRWLLDAWD